MSVSLSKIESFSGLGEDALAALGDASEIRQLKGGEYLVRQGEEADALYIVNTGRFDVELGDGRLVAEVAAGEPVGELAFFSGGTRTAHVRATRDSSVLMLTKQAYAKVAKKHPELADGILAVVAKRLATTTASSREVPAKPGQVVAMIPAGSAPLPEGIAKRIEKSLAKYDKPRLVTVQDLPDGLDPASANFGQWLGELEQKGARIILRAGENEAWNQAIVRNSDDLLLVAPLYEKDHALSPLEKFALSLFREKNCRLILWRDQVDDDIHGTAQWLAERPVALHHHVAIESEEDSDRVARFIAGKANGVVLAGGGALGCAHIGVMQALIENGVPIDYYGGTSAGAAMAGALARGLNAEDTLEQMQEMFITKKAMKRMTIPVHSFLDARVFDEELRSRYSLKDIVDLPYNYFGVSTNLSTNSIYVHRDGPLWEAVRASGSLPTILPPFVTAKGDILVDGGVLDNIPVQIMRECKAGPNVVVALRADVGSEWRIEAEYKDVRTPGRILKDMLLRRKPEKAFPSLVEIMSRSMVVASEGAVQGNLSHADVMLLPPIPETMQILDWHLGKDISDAARIYTAEQIAKNADLKAMKAP